MKPNPFEPPSELADDGARAAGSDVRLYTHDHVAIAAFLGAPVAAFWLIGANEAALGKPRRKATMVMWGVVTTALVMTLAYFLPENMPGFILPATYTFMFRELA